MDTLDPAGFIFAFTAFFTSFFETSNRAEGKAWGGRKLGTRIAVTEEKELAIYRMKADDVPIAEIARVLGLTRRTIYKTLKRKVTAGTV